MEDKQLVVAHHDAAPGSLASYVSGFGLSVVLTITAYLVVTKHAFSGWWLVGAILLLAVVQLAVQLVCFLHLGRGSKPRWNAMTFGLMLIFLFIVVLGSLWIMHNLNYRMMASPEEVNQYINSQGNL